MLAAPFLLPLALLAAPAEAGRKPKLPKERVHLAIPPERVAAGLAGLGLSSQQKTDSMGDPMLTVSVDFASGMIVNFYDCAPEGCGAAQYRVWWTTGGRVPVDFANTHNRDHRFGRVYLDQDEDVVFELLVEAGGGVTPAHLDEQRARFFSAAMTVAELLQRGG